MTTKKAKYIGGWAANNGSSYNNGYEFASLAIARKTMRTICIGNVFVGNTGSWTVEDMDGEIVASGKIKR